MRAWRFAALGIAAYGLFLLATMPASVAFARVELPPGVHVEQVTGSAWHGSLRIVLDAPAGAMVLDGIEWRLSPAALLTGRLAGDVTAASPLLTGRARLSRGLTRTALDDVDLVADARLAAAASPLAGAWRPQGRIALQASHLDWDGRQAFRGDGQVEWRQAVVTLPDAKALGSYRAQLHGDGGPAHVTLATLDGALVLRGEGTWTPDTFDFKGDARAQGPGAEAVTPLLDLIGPRRADGSRPIALRWP